MDYISDILYLGILCMANFKCICVYALKAEN
jgi:hypothetical protein